MTRMTSRFVISPPERRRLRKMAKSRSARSEDSRRARIVLALAKGASLRKLSARGAVQRQYCEIVAGALRGRTTLGTVQSASWTATWSRKRATSRAHHGLDLASQTLALGGATQWSTRALARALGTNQSRVARVWANLGLQPHRLRRYMASNDPDFETKAADIIALYLKPPLNAAVFCVDEKSAIEALDRLDPAPPLSPGRAERHGFEDSPPWHPLAQRRAGNPKRPSLGQDDTATHPPSLSPF